MRPSVDVVCYYADLGNDYLPLIRRMTASAKAVMPHCRTVLVTPTPSADLSTLFDSVVSSHPYSATVENLCYERARATVSWQMFTKRPTILADPDIEFRRPVSLDDDCDITLSWRPGKQDQPVNSGLVISRPGVNGFWKKYGDVVANLPISLHGWWCDQMAYSLMTGVCHQAGDILNIMGARIRLVDQRIMCAKPEDAAEDAWALHYKGNRKWAVVSRKKARSIASSGAGTPSLASA